MSEWRQLGEITETNPETLSATTDPDYSFKYIDLGSVAAGNVNLNSLQEFKFSAAPSRARRRVRPGDVLFGTVRPNLQSHGYVPENRHGDLVASTGFSVIRARQGVAHGRFLFFTVLGHNIYAQSVNSAVGSNYPAVNDNDVRHFLVFAPPVEQQEKIAQILDTLDTQIRQTEALIAKLESIKQGLLTDLLTRGIDENGQLRLPPEKAPHLYKDSRLGWIPADWELAPLGTFSASRRGSFVNGPFGSDLLTGELCDEGVPVLYVKDLAPGELRRVSTSHVTETKADELSICNVIYGDVLIAKVGDPPGIAASYREEQRAIVTQDVIRIRPSQNVSAEFLVSLLNSPLGRSVVQRIVIEGTRSRVSLTEFKSLLLPKPKYDEQERIGGRLLAVQSLINNTESTLSKLTVQKSGLMDDLLTGRVRVTPLLDTANQAVG